MATSRTGLTDFTPEEKAIVLRHVIDVGHVKAALRGLEKRLEPGLNRVPAAITVTQWLASDDPAMRQLIQVQRIDLAQGYFENAKALNEEVYAKAQNAPLNQALYGASTMGEAYLKMVGRDQPQSVGPNIQVNVTLNSEGPKKEDDGTPRPA